MGMEPEGEWNADLKGETSQIFNQKTADASLGLPHGTGHDYSMIIGTAGLGNGITIMRANQDITASVQQGPMGGAYAPQPGDKVTFRDTPETARGIMVQSENESLRVVPLEEHNRYDEPLTLKADSTYSYSDFAAFSQQQEALNAGSRPQIEIKTEQSVLGARG